jgi:dolichol kinase
MPIAASVIGIFPVVFFISFVAVLYAASEVRRMERTSLPIIASVTRYAATQEEMYELATAPMFFALGIVLTLLVFPMPVSGAAIAAFALGDSTASLFGKAIGKRFLPFNKGKTLEGSVISFFFAFLASLYFVAPLPALIAAGAAVIVESLPLPLNDNLVTPLVTGLVLALAIA